MTIMKTRYTVFNFSGIYEQESFYLSDKGSSFCGKLLDFRGISGTNCMCDDVAKLTIRNYLVEYARQEALRETGCSDYSETELLSEFAKGIHFIDSGNYHYLSALLLDMVKEPFSLVVLDHHPDMQPSMFGGILSCGGWVKEVLDTNPFVRDVHVIGADRSLIEKLDLEDVQKVHFYDREDIVISCADDILSAEEKSGTQIVLPATEYPVYLSIDKDVIVDSELKTNWDQGEFGAREVLDFTKALLTDRKVIGVDICGECAPDQEGIDVQAAIEGNDEFNSRMIDILSACNSGNVDEI